MSEGKNEKEGQSFETLVKGLEEVVAQLESGELSLENSLKMYEKGVGFVRAAQEKLQSMEGKIEELTAEGKKKSLEVAG